MKVLIDDLRDYLPDGGIPDVIIRNFETGKWALKYLITEEDEVYIDHDLGDINKSGYDLMCILEDGIRSGETYLPAKVECVSDNGSGRQRIQLVIDKLYGRLRREETQKEAQNEIRTTTGRE